MNPFAELLVELRWGRRLTQRDLALRSGLTSSAICRYEAGNRVPSKADVERLALALEADVTALLHAAESAKRV